MFKDNCALLELSKVLIGQPGTQNGREEGEEAEGVVDDGGVVLGVVELCLQVDR